MDEKIIKNIIQPLKFMEENLNKVDELYNKRILNQRLTRELHTHLYRVFQGLLDKLKVITNRLENQYDNMPLWAIANGYAHGQNISFEYYYESGVHVCDHSDVPPIYITGTFDPEKVIDKRIERIEIVLSLQPKMNADDAKRSVKYEVNQFLLMLRKMIDEVKDRFID